ncbi:MAG: MFS transporter [Chloroflexi bacterium]|nr:MFS transporter [Chloroflexota bacterium]
MDVQRTAAPHGTPVQNPAPVVARPARGGALAVPAFRIFAAAILSLSLGVWLVTVAQMWMIQELTGSPFYLGLVQFFWGVPMVSLSLFGGVVADRMDRRTVLVITRGVNTLVVAALAALALTGAVQAWHILLFSFAGGILMAFDIPARQSLIPTLVPRDQLTSVVAIHSALWSGANVIGPAIAGPVIAAVGATGCFVLGAVCSAIAVGCFLTIRTSTRLDASALSTVPQEGPRPSVFEGLREGFRYIAGNRAIVALLTLNLAPTIIGQSYMSQLPAYTAEVLHGDAVIYSQLLSAGGAGALLATASIAFLGRVGHKGPLVTALAAAFGALLAVLAFVSWQWAALVMLALLGAASSTFFTLSNTAMHEILEDRVRARVTSVYMLTFGLQSLGSLAVGSAAMVVGVPTALAVAGAVTLSAVALTAVRFPELRRIS